MIKSKTEDQNWDQCKIHAMLVYGTLKCRNLLVTIMYVCMYACIVIYFICTETSCVVVDCLKAPCDIHLYFSTLAFCATALTAFCSAPIPTFPSKSPARHAQIDLCLTELPVAEPGRFTYCSVHQQPTEAIQCSVFFHSLTFP